jgi:2'-hydroxyisoflavone reductase
VKSVVVRAGLIVGPYDYSDRFTYWPARVARGGEVLAPGRPARSIRVIDARDLAAWILTMVESSRAGIYNATGPEGQTMGELLEACLDVSGAGAQLTWTDEAFLIEQGAGPWVEVPLWLPEPMNGIFAVHNDRAIAEGLTFRPLSDTVRATLAWDRARDPDEPRFAGLAPSRELDLLRAWHARTSPSRDE